ncbi:MAG: hypothetical protein J6386_01410 [Candidatus Synoicihabitans palmerolidicus]|nr:hypothetical protein [Candidatus Synoicihabitans palmerolidicus]
MLATGISAQTSAPTSEDLDLATLSLEDLLQVKVTSVSRKSESLFGAPAAIFSINSAEIRSLGAVDLATALRAAPGVQVG